ncbi:GRAM domain-containing protein 4-like [Sinocyclocheilus grahami]|uniref:GRAM domain-containing protein 4-like n=1 Tax=Sinocyclocheilus grahami TaxID=75366 RepID=UPI0007ACB969|nr:PREDICTED: GRAM domain-containing protein 4-like [Sinocyclocheilus grahami]
MKLNYEFRARVTTRHVKIKTQVSVLNMLKRLDKIRFRGPKRDEFLDLAESPNASDSECNEDVPVKHRSSIKETEEQRDPAGSGTMSAAPIQDYKMSDADRLNEVKGHLEITLLEKHFLQEELRKLREETNVETLKQDLEKEKLKRVDLEQKMNEILRSRLEDSPPPPPPPKPQVTSVNGTGDKQKETLSSRLWKWLYERFGVYMEDFRFKPEENTVETEEPLSAKRLTENMRRLKRGAKPVTNFMRNLSALSSCHSVYTSAIAFIIYMNAAWHGWVIPMFLFLAILRLSLNYLIAKGWRIQWSIVPEVSEPVEPPKEDLTVSEKFQLVLDVAQKAQNLFGKMADVLEKIKKINSFACSSQQIQPVVARGNQSAGMSCGIGREEESGRAYNTKRGPFHEVFNLSENERPLPVCENGWRCCLINRDRKMPTDYIRNGVLYVTENYLCFESSSSRATSSKKNKVIKLQDITDIQKYKVLSVLPGSGMGISITTPSTLKPLVFGAMIHRDEAFDAIHTQYMKIMNSTAATTVTNPET